MTYLLQSTFRLLKNAMVCPASFFHPTFHNEHSLIFLYDNGINRRVWGGPRDELRKFPKTHHTSLHLLEPISSQECPGMRIWMPTPST